MTSWTSIACSLRSKPSPAPTALGTARYRSLPPFAVQALRSYRRQQHRLRLALAQTPTLGLRWVGPSQPPHQVELDLVFRTERHAGKSQPRQPRLRPTAPRRRRRARPTGVHPPAAPDRAPLGWGDRGRVRPGGARWPAGGVGWASGGGKVEGNPALEPVLIGRPRTALLLVRGYVAGTGFEPV